MSGKILIFDSSINYIDEDSKELAKQENVTEELKANNQLEWVRKNEQYYELLRQNKNLNWVLEGQNEGRNLNNYECKMLSKLVQTSYDTKEIEAKE